MAKFMKHTIIICLFLLAACSNLKASESSADEYTILLSSLLGTDKERFTFTDKNGNKQIDSLARFKELEKVYINNINPDLANNKFSNKRLKIVMLYSFYSFVKKSAAFQEYLAADLMPIYIRNSADFLKVLNELPFLIEANCNRLNAYFGFEGKNTDKKPTFVKQHANQFKKYLNTDQYELCIRSFHEKPNK